MLTELKSKLQDLIYASIQKAYDQSETIPPVELETPADKNHGDFSCNIALKSAKLLKKSPLDIAGQFIPLIEEALGKSKLAQNVSKLEVKAPGFINIFLAPQAVHSVIDQVFQKKEAYGQCGFGANQKIQIEFVSANPTGPLSIAHARQAAVGDVLGNILKAIGFDVCKEYYINDGGNQINILGDSIKLRGLELLGEQIEFPEDHYQGEYIKDMAKLFMGQNQIVSPGQLKELDEGVLRSFGCDHLLDIIKSELYDFGVEFDVWSHESKIATKETIEGVLAQFKEKKFLYEKDGALWFRSTDYGDDKDRVVQKSDGSYTYLTPDIVYHKNKFERGFDRIFNIWGPDHHGYIARLKAAAQALGRKAEDLEVLIVQLATIYRDGKAVSMSTRRGQYISLREVLDEVGADAARFFFLMRHIKVHLDFDLELAKKQTPENPVYYIQYAHARVFSINAKAQESKISADESSFALLTQPEEIDLIKKMGDYPDTLIRCYEQLDPYPLVGYMQELAASFHKFYDCHKVIDPDNAPLSSQRLALANAARIVIANSLHLLGVAAPESM